MSTFGLDVYYVSVLYRNSAMGCQLYALHIRLCRVVAIAVGVNSLRAIHKIILQNLFSFLIVIILLYVKTKIIIMQQQQPGSAVSNEN